MRWLLFALGLLVLALAFAWHRHAGVAIWVIGAALACGATMLRGFALRCFGLLLALSLLGWTTSQDMARLPLGFVACNLLAAAAIVACIVAADLG